MRQFFSSRKDNWDIFFSWISSIILLPFLIFYIINRGAFTFPDYINLLIHEGGHGIFRIFNDFIYTAGGTVMQLLIPAMFFTFYFIKKNKPGFQIALFWFGESMMNVSVYASDARTHALPLLGGNKTYHDWTWMLSRLDLMAYDTLIGDIFYYSGIVCFIIVFFAPLIIKPENKSARTADIDLNL